MKFFFNITFFFFLLITSALGHKVNNVSLQLQWKHQFQFAGYYMAKEKGFYKDLGFNVTIKEFDYGMNVPNEIINKRSTFGTGRPTLLINRSNGDKVVLLASIFQSSPNVFLTTNPEIKTIQDFKNKRVMVTGDAQQDATIMSMVFSQGLTIKDFIIQEHTFNLNDLIDNNTDLMSSYISNEPFLLKEKGIEGIVFDPKDYGFDFYNDILFTTQEYLENNPQDVQEFTQASLKGWEYAFNNIEETVELILKKYNTQNKSKEALLFEAKELKKLAYYNTNNLGTIKKEKVEKIFGYYKLMGFVKNDINFNDFITPSRSQKIYLTQKEKNYLKEKKQLTLCIDPNWMPFEAYTNNQYIGISSEFIKTFSQNLNIPITVLPTNSWAESINEVKQKNCDMLPLITRTKKREAYLDFTTPYITLPVVIATKIGVPFSDEITQLKNKKVGIVKEYSLIQKFKKQYPELTIVEVNSVDDGLKKVKNGEIFGLIDNSTTINQAIQQQYIGTLVISGKFEEQWELAIGTRNDEPELSTIFQKAVDNITQKKYQEIFDKWSYMTISNSNEYPYLKEFLIFIILVITVSLFWMNQLSKTNSKLKKRDAELEELNQSLEKKIALALKENQEKERLLMQKNKLADMGDMIKNIAHQWRQPLAASNMAITLIKEKNKQNSLTNEYLEEKLDNVESLNLHMSQTIEDFLSFFTPKKEAEEFDIETSVNKTLSLLQPQIDKHEITVFQNIEDDLIMKSYLDDYIQVLISIITNSFQAYKKDQTKKLYINAKEIKGKIQLEISDNAGGIPENIIDKVFDPYFTTKHQSDGTGLGLYISKMIIENKIGGTLSVQNSNEGALFTIITKREIQENKRD